MLGNENAPASVGAEARAKSLTVVVRKHADGIIIASDRKRISGRLSLRFGGAV